MLFLEFNNCHPAGIHIQYSPKMQETCIFIFLPSCEYPIACFVPLESLRGQIRGAYAAEQRARWTVILSDSAVQLPKPMTYAILRQHKEIRQEIRATLAQSVEQPLRKRPVSGPSPEGGLPPGPRSRGLRSRIPQPAMLGFLFS